MGMLSLGISQHLESCCLQHASCRDIIREAPKDLCCALDGKLLMDPAARHMTSSIRSFT